MVQVREFTKAFNKIDVDLRGSDEVKAELLLRTTELRDALWDACDKRLEQNQAKLTRLRSQPEPFNLYTLLPQPSPPLQAPTTRLPDVSPCVVPCIVPCMVQK